MSLKFKNRIAYFNTLAVALITLLVFMVIYFVVHTTAFAHLDKDITTEKDEVINNLDWHHDSIIINKMPEWDEAEHNKVEVNPTFLQIVDLKGRVVFHSTNLLTDRFPYNPKITSEIFYDDVLSNQKIRLGQFPIYNDTGKVIGQLTIAISRQESYIILHNLVLVLLMAFPLVLIVLFLASSFAASKAIEPVHQLIKTASGISDSTIGTRLVLPARKDELYDLTQTINDLLARIEVSLMKQKQFTSDASHEMRTPLAAIRGTLEVLIRKQREPEVYADKIGSIIEQVDRLDALLDQLLKLARMESGGTIVNMEMISLLKVITSLEEKWKAPSKGNSISIHVHVDEKVMVKGDSLYLEIMLDNLVNNAIKYGRKDGRVDLTWNQDTRSLAIRDDGYGIPDAHLPHIFDRFYRVDASRGSAVKGAGIGLSIVKKLADLQSISLTAVSKESEGSTFTMTFPR
ncbi:MAG: HAMP domain-containing sensor histidine kinase [Saprospiraceae bacterium]|nr:HAMP domain-containing sensor histidine kinase [Saprospiraceae bacterium]